MDDFGFRDAAGFGIDGKDSPQVGGFEIRTEGPSLLNYSRNRKKGDAGGQECADGDFIGRVEYGRRDAAGLHRLPRQPEQGKARLVHRPKFQ